MELVDFLLFLVLVNYIVCQGTQAAKYLDSIQTGLFSPTAMTLDCSSSSHPHPYYKTYSWIQTYNRPFKHLPQIFVGIHSINNCNNPAWYHALINVNGNLLQIFLSYQLHYHECSKPYTLGLNYFAVDVIDNNNIERALLSATFNKISSVTFNFKRQIDNSKSAKMCFLISSSYEGQSGNILSIKLDVNIISSKKFSCVQTVVHQIFNYQISYVYILGIAIFPSPEVLILFGYYDTNSNSPFIGKPIPFDRTQTLNKYFIGLRQVGSNVKRCINIIFNHDLLTIDSISDLSVSGYYFYFIFIQIQRCPISHPTDNKIDLSIPGVGFHFTPQQIISEKQSVIRYESNEFLNNLKMFVFQSMQLEMSVYVFKKIIQLKIVKCNFASIDSFTLNDSRIKKKFVSFIDGSAILTLQYEGSIIGQQWKLIYSNKFTISQCYFIVNIPKISNISCSMTAKQCSLQVSKLSQATSTTNTQLFWQQNTLVQNGIFYPPDSNNVIKTTFDRLPRAQNEFLNFNRTFKYYVPMFVFTNIMIVKQIQYYHNDLIAKVLTNIPISSNYQFQDFQCNSGVVVESAIAFGNETVLFLNLLNYEIGNEFYIKYLSSVSPQLQVTIQNVNILPLKQVITEDKKYNKIVLDNLFNVPLVLSEFKFLQFHSQSLSFESFDSSDNQIFIKSKINKWVCTPQPLNASFNVTTFSQFTYYVNIVIKQLRFGAETLNKTIQIISILLSVLYLIVFIFSIFCCRKLYGIELMFIIHLAYYSMIPIDIYCEPYQTLNRLKTSLGYNPFFQNLQQKVVNNNYRGVGIKSNFLSNINMMIIPIFILPLFYYPLKLIGEKSKDYTTSPRCLKYGQSLIFEVPLTILLFNSFNIYSSIVVNIQLFGWSNFQSLFTSLLLGCLLLMYIGIYIKFTDKFQQFTVLFDQFRKILKLPRQKCYQIRKKYIIVVILEMILIPIFLAIKVLFDFSLYIILFIQVFVTTFEIIVPLYSTSSTNFRSYLYRFIIILICCYQILAKNLKPQYTFQSTFYIWYPIGLLFLIFIGFCCTGIFTIYQCIKFIKSPKLIDNSMRLKQITTLTKPTNQLNPSHTGMWIQRNQYVVYKKQRQQREQLEKQSPLMQKNKNNQYSNFHIKQKIQKWFKQIQQYNFFDQLGIDRIFYKNCSSNSSSFKQNFINKLFLPNINIYQILQNHNQIITLKDMSNFIGLNQIQIIRQYNQRFGSHNRLL